MQPYKYSTVKNNYYQFTTETGNLYTCYFLSYASYFEAYADIAENIFAFNIDVTIKGKANSSDPRLAATIVLIITTFLNGLANAVVYVCDASDNREILRKKSLIYGSVNTMTAQL